MIQKFLELELNEYFETSHNSDEINEQLCDFIGQFIIAINKDGKSIVLKVKQESISFRSSLFKQILSCPMYSWVDIKLNNIKSKDYIRSLVSQYNKKYNSMVRIDFKDDGLRVFNCKELSLLNESELNSINLNILKPVIDEVEVDQYTKDDLTDSGLFYLESGRKPVYPNHFKDEYVISKGDKTFDERL